MDLPLFVVGEEDGRGQRAAVDEKDEADGEVGDDGAFEGLVAEGDLDLGGEEDEEGHGEEEPLGFEEAGEVFEELLAS